MKTRRSWWYFLALLFVFSIITRGCFDLFRVDWNALFSGNGVEMFLARTFLPIVGVMAIVGGIVAAFYLSSKDDSHKYVFARVLWIGIFPAIVLAAPYLISRTSTKFARMSRENVHALSCVSPFQTHWSSDSVVAPGWKLPGQRYVVLNISAEHATTRDSLKAILHTVEIGNF